MDITQSESITQAAGEALATIGIEDDSKAEMLAQLITGGVSQWQEILPTGETLTLLRLYSPVVDREEVFLGSILFNDFLNKAVVDTAKTLSAQVAPVIQDLENGFVLLRSQQFDVVAFSKEFRQMVEKRLPDLLLGHENLDRGIHGDAKQMLTFYKSNIEPFPVFILPCEQLPQLLKVVANWLRTLAGSDGPKKLADADHIPLEVAERWRINVILSLLSFFFAKDGLEMQSFHRFLSQAIADDRLPATEVKRAFGMTATDEFEKKKFEAAKKGSAGVDFESLEIVIAHWIQKVEVALNSGTVDAMAPNLNRKMFSSNTSVLTDLILSGTQLGTVLFDYTQTSPSTAPVCRFCGASTAEIPEKNILGGSKTGGRFNQSVRKADERFCLRCALASYLENRRLGMLFDDGGFPIPKLYNIIFHYGHYQDWEIRAIQRQIDYIFHRKERNIPTPQLLEELIEIRDQVYTEVNTGEVPDHYDDPWEALDAAEPVARVSQAVADACQRDIQADVLTLGAGSEKLLVFVLPQLRPGSKDGLDFVQRRFSQSRLATFTLLAFLQRLTSSHGPWYFQSLPRLAPGHMQADHFYIHNRAEPVERNLGRYSRIVDFAQRVVKYRDGHSQLADQIMLADRLRADPLGVFSEVLRDSPIRGGDDFDMQYKRLSNDWEPTKGLGVVNLNEYQEIYQNLYQTAKGEDTMPKNIDVEKLNVFCDHLFRALDHADLFPIGLGDAAHAFEKYPRLLAGLLGRYQNVETGFSEWKTKALRGVNQQKRESVYPYYHALENWLVASENRELFETEEHRKDTLNHLKRSLYGRVYAWLYPRRRLTVAYVQEHIGNRAQFEPEAIDRDFKTAIQPPKQELGDVVNESVIEDAREFLIANRGRYRSWKPNQESIDSDNNETTLAEEDSQ